MITFMTNVYLNNHYIETALFEDIHLFIDWHAPVSKLLTLTPPPSTWTSTGLTTMISKV